MSEKNLSAELLKQAELASGTLPREDREALWRRINAAHLKVRRLKRAVMAAVLLLVVSLVTLLLAKNGPDKDHGIRLLLTYLGSFGYLAGFYGGILLLIGLVLQFVSTRAMEMSGRLANMETLLESVVANLEQLAHSVQKPSQLPSK